jgi:hypothetical protein
LTIATWGRGADPDLLLALQPFRQGLGFNGSIVARVPRERASEFLPEEAFSQLSEAQADGIPVYSAVFKDWTLDYL